MAETRRALDLAEARELITQFATGIAGMRSADIGTQARARTVARISANRLFVELTGRRMNPGELDQVTLQKV